jgi:hypothetical protein
VPDDELEGASVLGVGQLRLLFLVEEMATEVSQLGLDTEQLVDDDRAGEGPDVADPPQLSQVSFLLSLGHLVESLVLLGVVLGLVIRVRPIGVIKSEEALDWSNFFILLLGLIQQVHLAFKFAFDY